MKKQPPKHPLLPPTEPTLRLMATQPNANPKGDIFGGWLMSQIDLAASIHAFEYSKGPVATVSVNQLQFINPIYVGDLVSFYAELVKVGNSSLSLEVEVFAQRCPKYSEHCVKVGEASLTFVAISEPGKKRQLPTYKE